MLGKSLLGLLDLLLLPRVVFFYKLRESQHEC